MLKITELKSNEEKESILNQLNTSDSTWIVSDLTSKLSIQRKIFEKTSIIPDDALLRANEFWKKIFPFFFPKYQVLSKDATLFYIEKFFSSQPKSWVQKPGVAEILYSYLQSFGSILAHPNRREILGDFFKKNIDSYQKWGDWYLQSESFFDWIKEKNKIPFHLIPALISSAEVSSKIWKRKIFIDLGSQLLAHESEAFLNLSKQLDIEVLVPDFTLAKDEMKFYNNYRCFGINKKQSLSNSKKEIQGDFVKLPTQLSEVMDVVAKIRKLIDQQVDVSKIAIVAPDIKNYWPALKAYLNYEGIPFRRADKVSYMTLPCFLGWFSRLNLNSKDVSFEDLQALYVEKNIFSELLYEKFYSLYKNFYDNSDLNRSQFVFDHISKLKLDIENIESEISVSVFLQISLNLWLSEEGIDNLMNLIQKILEDFGFDERLTFFEWVQIIKSYASKLEITVSQGSQIGIEVVDLISAKDLDLDFAFYIGLTDQNMRSNLKTHISPIEAEYFYKNYGFILSDNEKIDLEFEFIWNSISTKRKNLYYFPEYSFDGSRNVPSYLWLRGISDVKKFKDKSIAESPRLGQVQRKKISEYSEAIQRTIKKELGQEEINFGNVIIDSLSASQFESYFRCPFIHASEKLFRLKKFAEVDVDLDFISRGRVLHGMAEFFYKRFKTFQLSNQEIEVLFDEVLSELDYCVVDSKIWLSQKNKYVKIFKKFLEFENLWKNSFPELSEVLCEKEFSIFIDMNTFDVKKSSEKNTVLLKGKIDRLDVDESGKACVIVDYKFDINEKHTNYEKWLESGQFQLAIYSYLVQEGVLDVKFDVLGAVYYGFKSLNRKKGFLVIEADGYLYKLESRQSGISLENRDALFQNIKSICSEISNKMKNGIYHPRPQREIECLSCDWKNVCRAPHLN